MTALTVGRLPRAWTRAEDGSYLFEGTVSATVRAFAPLGANPDYLLQRVGARGPGPLGRPTVQSLPEALDEGVSVVAFEEADDGSLGARIDLVRRAWDVDILVSARSTAMESVDTLFSAMLDLLAVVTPEGGAR